MTTEQIFDRTRLLTGDETMERISKTRVIIFGIGGVGSWAAESLVRTGIGHITLVDSDTISASNINRQLPATTLTVGASKVEMAQRHLLEINPNADIKALTLFYSEETADCIDLTQYDYIVDAIDSLKDKALLILNATRTNKKLFSSMGAALKMDPSRIKVAEFWDVKGCPLARSLRNRFKKEHRYPSKKFKCVFSDELLENQGFTSETCEYKAQINGSISHITGIFGLMIAGEIIKDICKREYI